MSPSSPYRDFKGLKSILEDLATGVKAFTDQGIIWLNNQPITLKNDKQPHQRVK